jgi:hypothetical protein
MLQLGEQAKKMVTEQAKQLLGTEVEQRPEPIETTDSHLRGVLGPRMFNEFKAFLDEAAKKNLEEKVWDMEEMFKKKSIEALNTFDFRYTVDSEHTINLLNSIYVIDAKRGYENTRRFCKEDFYDTLLKISSTNNSRQKTEVKEDAPASGKEKEKEKEKSQRKEKKEEVSLQQENKKEKEGSPEKGKENKGSSPGNEKEKEAENPNVTPESHTTKTEKFQILHEKLTAKLELYAENKSKLKNKVKKVDIKVLALGTTNLSLSDFVPTRLIAKRGESIELLSKVADDLKQDLIKDRQGQPYSDEQKCKLLFGALISELEPMQKERESNSSFKMWKEKLNPSKFLAMAVELKKEFISALGVKPDNLKQYETECKEAYAEFNSVKSNYTHGK